MQAVADRIGSRGLNPFIDVALELFALLGVHSAVHNVHKIGKLTDAKVESMQDVAKHAFDLPKAPALIPSVMEEIKAEVMETDAQCGESMDRVEREIGPSEIRTGIARTVSSRSKVQVGGVCEWTSTMRRLNTLGGRHVLVVRAHCRSR